MPRTSKEKQEHLVKMQAGATTNQLLDQVQIATDAVDIALHSLIIALERLEDCDNTICDEHVIHNMLQIANAYHANFQSEFASLSTSLHDANS
jgi:hypothetical protein